MRLLKQHLKNNSTHFGKNWRRAIYECNMYYPLIATIEFFLFFLFREQTLNEHALLTDVLS